MKLLYTVLSCGVVTSVAALPINGKASDEPSVSRRGSGKRGLVYTDPSLPALFSNSPISWGYNYQSSAGETTPFEFVPMLYNGQDPNWQSNAQQAISSGSQHLLAFNEPDQPTSAGGTAIDPNTAASLYQQQMNPFQGQAQLGAPAVSAGGLSWLQQFAQACNGGCNIDFIPLHFYASPDQSPQVQAESLEGFMSSAIPEVREYFNNPNLPIWITEFAALPADPINLDIATEYMSYIMPWMEQNSDIARYSYFYANQLASNGQLNTAGQQYAA